MSPVRALVVDDEPGIARLCQFFLESAAYSVTITTNPHDAVELIKQQNFDILLTDVRMPQMDGFELLKITKIYQPDMAVLFMTAFGTVEIAIQALRSGADGLILKPFSSSSDLIEAVNQALQDKHQKRDAARLQALKPLFEISEKLISETNMENLIQLILDSMENLFLVEHVGVYLPQADQTGFSLVLGMGQPFPWTEEHLQSGFLKQAYIVNQPIFVNQGDTAPSDLTKMHEQKLMGGYIFIPLEYKDRKYFIVASRNAAALPFTASDLEMFVVLARQCAVAIENAELYNDLRGYIRKIEESQRALIQAEKMAAVGRLMASLAHEVNNPLQSVRNCLILVSRPDVPEGEKREYLDLAQGEIDRLSGTLQRMLEFYRPGRKENVSVDVEKMVHTVKQLMRPQIKAKQIQLIFENRFTGARVRGMPDQLQQVIFNLLLNAVDAVEQNPDNKIIWFSISEQNGWLKISVEDNGKGIEPGFENQIFEPFVSSKEKGTGLGLAVSYGIIEAHGGNLELGSSVHGNGACFNVLLPIEVDAV